MKIETQAKANHNKPNKQTTAKPNQTNPTNSNCLCFFTQFLWFRDAMLCQRANQVGMAAMVIILT